MDKQPSLLGFSVNDEEIITLTPKRPFYCLFDAKHNTGWLDSNISLNGAVNFPHNDNNSKYILPNFDNYH